MSGEGGRHVLVVICVVMFATVQTMAKAEVGPPAPQELDDGPDSMETIINQNEEIFEDIYDGRVEPYIVDSDVYDPTANETRARRNAISDRRRLWPGGVVPYVIDGYFSTNERKYILSAMQRFHEKTCITFRPRTIERDFISVTEGDGCWSMIGRRGGRQTVSLGGTCKHSRGTIMHELMHALGFRHEHNRPDRDNFVVLYWENIDKKMWDNFAKYAHSEVTLLDTGYDYLSIMHYPIHAFSKNGGQTIGPKFPTYDDPGTRNDFSYVDVYRITALYRCGSCYDSDKDNCPTWAIMGECRRSSVWMQKYCPYSCESCNKADYGGGDCRDYSNNCERWAEIGECDRNPDFMGYNCKMSCGYCKAPHDIHSRRECYDDSTLCSDWAQLNECYNNPKYMKKTCRKSCGICQETERDITVGDGDCRDLHPLCHIWARHGVCQTYAVWMLDNCALSCWRCANKTGVNVTIEEEEPVADVQQPRRHVVCQNVKKQCTRWAESGRCTKEPDYMYVHCLKSCGMCIDERVTGVKGASICEDQYSMCNIWSQEGDCLHDLEWMRAKCPISCEYCHMATVETRAIQATKEPPCKDRFTTCTLWAGNGECDIAVEWMSKNCPKSCQICEGGEKDGDNQPGCLDTYQRCPSWAANGECLTNPEWLNVYCRKSCRQCDQPREPSSGCNDVYRRCKRMVEGDVQACRDDENGWMRINCPLSCGFCGVYGGDDDGYSTETRLLPDPGNDSTSSQLNDTEGPCRDFHPHCSRWAETGNCRVNVRYMKNNCRKSCGYCATCFDKDATCRTWAKRGDCLANPQGLKKICPMSCGNCGPAPEGCSDTHKQCAKWAKRGYCPTHSHFMHKFCKISCKTCNNETTSEEDLNPATGQEKAKSAGNVNVGGATNSTGQQTVVKRPKKRPRRQRRKQKRERIEGPE